MTATQLLRSAWDWDPSVIVGCVLLIVFYFCVRLPRKPKNTVMYVAGVTAMFLSLVSPLDVLSDEYLFSAHMLQHLFLILAVPPLMICGIPRQWWERLLIWKPAQATERVLGRPAIAWFSSLFAIAVWHVPELYDAALANENIHIVEHLCFLVTATMFWWPIVTPVESRRLSAATGIAYLLSAMLVNIVLGIVITFAPVGIYSAYAKTDGDPAIWSLVRQHWGLTPKADLQLGGLLMWVPGCSVYLLFIIALVLRWFLHPEQEPSYSVVTGGVRDLDR